MSLIAGTCYFSCHVSPNSQLSIHEPFYVIIMSVTSVQRQAAIKNLLDLVTPVVSQWLRRGGGGVQGTLDGKRSKFNAYLTIQLRFSALVIRELSECFIH